MSEESVLALHNLFTALLERDIIARSCNLRLLLYKAIRVASLGIILVIWRLMACIFCLTFWTLTMLWSVVPFCWTAWQWFELFGYHGVGVCTAHVSASWRPWVTLNYLRACVVYLHRTVCGLVCDHHVHLRALVSVHSIHSLLAHTC